ncbi:MAG: hypothetical protein ABL857_09025 [Rickettsiales bacterium]
MNDQTIRKTATRQKKVIFWSKELLSEDTPQDQKNQINSLLSQYKSFLNEILKTERPQETEEKILVIERQLNDLFESRRLLTDKNGVAAIDC